MGVTEAGQMASFPPTDSIKELKRISSTHANPEKKHPLNIILKNDTNHREY